MVFPLVMSSLTQRSSGLVQRRAAAERERSSPGEEEHEPRRDEQDDDDGGDAKETRLTLMEEVLLLGLKDREVNSHTHFLSSGSACTTSRLTFASSSFLQSSRNRLAN